VDEDLEPVTVPFADALGHVPGRADQGRQDEHRPCCYGTGSGKTGARLNADPNTIRT
jgi:hypothetical protein